MGLRAMSNTKKFHKALNNGSPKWKKKDKNQPVVTAMENRIHLAKRHCPMGNDGCLFPQDKSKCSFATGSDCMIVEQAMYCQKRSYKLPNIN